MNIRLFLTLPQVTRSSLKVWQRNFLYFKKNIGTSFFWIVFEPVVYLSAIGFGLGSFVNQMDGVSYIEFFFPALLSTTAMMVAFFEGTYGNYTKLTHQKTYTTIMLTKVGPDDIVIGELLWAASKSFIGVIGVIFIASFFGLVDSLNIVLALPVLFLIAWLFSCLAMIMTSLAVNYDSFIYAISGFIMPMSLLSGTYFPVEQMPGFVRFLSFLSPLTHGVTAVRAILKGDWNIWIVPHVLLLVVLGYLAMQFAIYRIKNKILV